MAEKIKQEPIDEDNDTVTVENSQRFLTSDYALDVIVKNEFSSANSSYTEGGYSQDENEIMASEHKTRSKAKMSIFTVTVDKRKSQPGEYRNKMPEIEQNHNLCDKMNTECIEEANKKEKLHRNRRRKSKTQKHVRPSTVGNYTDEEDKKEDILHYDLERNFIRDTLGKKDIKNEMSENLDLNNEILFENLDAEEENSSFKNVNIMEDTESDIVNNSISVAESDVSNSIIVTESDIRNSFFENGSDVKNSFTVTKSQPSKKNKIKSTKDKKLSKDVKVNEFPCSTCGKIFYKKKNLTIHFKIHIGDKKYVCEYCGKRFLTSKCLRRHERIHTGERPYKCDICGNGFICWSAKNVHMRVHTGAKPFQCEYCGKEFASKTGLTTHVANHTGNKPFNCSKCDKAFPLRRDLNIHEKTHSEDRPYTCQTCGMAFKRAGSLTEHEYRHMGEKPFTCELCGKGFYNRYKLKKHSLTHDGPNKTYRCCECNMLFTERELLKAHKKEHAKEQEVCPVCGKMIANNICLKRHMRLHSGQKPFGCDTCGKMFTQENNLKRHKLCHTGEKPYECSTCNKKFTQSGTLKAHVRLHTGERPFVCGVCGKGFAQQSNLRTHETKHLGKPHICDVCGKGFALINSLKLHTKRHMQQSLKSYDDIEASDLFMMKVAMSDIKETVIEKENLGQETDETEAV